MNTVFIVPTGIGAEIGGHAGDASPAAKLIASVSDIFITHPNVFNASDINEMPENTLYVEGSMLDTFLEGKKGLKRVQSNRICVAVNSPVRAETINAVSAARATMGLEAYIMELEKPLKMIARIDDGVATGEVHGWESLLKQLPSYRFDALAIATEIECDQELALKYLRDTGSVNPWGGVEAKVSKLISERIKKPVAHAPVELGALKKFNEVVDPRKAAEAISVAYIHCVLKGLHKAPQYGNEIWQSDIDCLVTPAGCYGPAHFASADANIPIIVVKNNTTTCDLLVDHHSLIYVENYLEAAGMILAIKAGISLQSINRPLRDTMVYRKLEAIDNNE